MRRIAKTLIAGTALLSLAVPQASAADYNDDQYVEYGNAEVLNGQINYGNVWSSIDVVISGVEEDVTAVTQAVGNTVNIYTMSNTWVDNEQVQNGTVRAEVNMDASDVGGNVLIGATALCNGAMISTDPDVTAVNSSQTCDNDDPAAAVNANLSDISGGVGIAATAVSNQIQVDSNARNFPIDTYQLSDTNTFATIDANISNVGQVDLSSSAVGNSATIIHY
jgi:hypothetical protein